MVKLLNSFINFLFPKYCYNCRCLIIDSENHLCDKCFSQLLFIVKPYCEKCGYPISKNIFDKDTANPNECTYCRKKNVPFVSCQSLMVYDDISKKLILPFKHRDESFLGKYFAYLSFGFKKDFIGNIDCIIPVPLHYKRFLKRKYNQAGVFAYELGKLFKKDVYDDVIVRKKFNTQKSLSYSGRQKSVHNVFALKNVNKIKGKKVLIVDDVMATGATVNEIAKVLKSAGADVYILTIARTIL